MTNNATNFHDYNIRIWNDEDGSLVGTYINADFNSNNGIFYHMSDDHLSIELGTHDEHLISEAISLCKEISNKFLMLDGLLAVINKEK